MSKHRLYIDEVGNSDLRASHNPNHRYLSLTGVIVSLDYAGNHLQPALEDLKRRYFGSHPDEPVVLHRKDLVNKRGLFVSLRDPVTCARFDRELLALIEGMQYTVITAVIDKLTHLTQYGRWAHDPYHYCLTILLERFQLWLVEAGEQGDVMAESRGGGEDMRLKREYERIFRTGTLHVGHADFVARLRAAS